MHHLCLMTAEAQAPGGSLESHLGKAGEQPSTAACPQGCSTLMQVTEGSWPSPQPLAKPVLDWPLWEGSLATSGSHSA